MQQVTVGTKYQIVIPKEIRSKIRGIIPGAKMTVYSDGKDIMIKSETKNWLERTRGMMKNAWQGIDTTEYLEDLRNEWDRK